MGNQGNGDDEQRIGWCRGYYQGKWESIYQWWKGQTC